MATNYEGEIFDVPFDPNNVSDVDIVATRIRTFHLYHPGNQRYVKLIQQYSENHMPSNSSSPQIYTKAANEICDILLTSGRGGGRFLKLPDNIKLHQMKFCRIMTRKECIAKTAHALRTAKKRLGEFIPSKPGPKGPRKSSPSRPPKTTIGKQKQQQKKKNEVAASAASAEEEESMQIKPSKKRALSSSVSSSSISDTTDDNGIIIENTTSANKKTAGRPILVYEPQAGDHKPIDPYLLTCIKLVCNYHNTTTTATNTTQQQQSSAASFAFKVLDDPILGYTQDDEPEKLRFMRLYVSFFFINSACVYLPTL